MFVPLVDCWLVVSCAPDQLDRPAYPPSLYPDRVMLTIPVDPATSRAVRWRSSYDKRSGVAELVLADSDPRHMEDARRVEVESVPWEEGSLGAMGYRVVFTGLSPATRYSYRVGDGESWSEWFQFTTSSNQNRDFSFLYFGDLQNDIKSLGSRLLRQAYRNSPRAEFILFVEDLVNRSLEENWGEFFYAGGWIFASTPTLASPGNHEYDKDDDGDRSFSRHWKPIFTFPENGPKGLDHRVYYLDYQGVRFISLDSYLVTSDETSRAEQIQWLEGALAGNPNNWTIVFMHHPVYSRSYGRDNPELRQGLKSVLEQAEVDLVLQGHDHTYCRGNTGRPLSDAGSVPVYLASVAGPKMYGLNVTDWKDKVGSCTQFYQTVHVSEAEITVDSYTVLGELYDLFKIVDSEGVKRFVENPVVSEIPTRSEIPKGFLERYRELYTE